jgi:hypothetical protein
MVKATDRPCRSVPHPTASWAAVKIIFSSYLIDSNFCQPPEAVVPQATASGGDRASYLRAIRQAGNASAYLQTGDPFHAHRGSGPSVAGPLAAPDPIQDSSRTRLPAASRRSICNGAQLLDLPRNSPRLSAALDLAGQFVNLTFARRNPRSTVTAHSKMPSMPDRTDRTD